MKTSIFLARGSACTERFIKIHVPGNLHHFESLGAKWKADIGSNLTTQGQIVNTRVELKSC